MSRSYSRFVFIILSKISENQFRFQLPGPLKERFSTLQASVELKTVCFFAQGSRWHTWKVSTFLGESLLFKNPTRTFPVVKWQHSRPPAGIATTATYTITTQRKTVYHVLHGFTTETLCPCLHNRFGVHVQYQRFVSPASRCWGRLATRFNFTVTCSSFKPNWSVTE